VEALGTDAAIIGGGLGACAAALAAARLGRRVILTEETHWIGRQLTNQAVPPDKHRWIEQFGATASYWTLRRGIRDYYRAHLPLTPDARARATVNPGNGWGGARLIWHGGVIENVIRGKAGQPPRPRVMA